MNSLYKYRILNKSIASYGIKHFLAQNPRHCFSYSKYGQYPNDEILQAQSKIPNPVFDQNTYQQLLRINPQKAFQYQQDYNLQVLQKKFYDNILQSENHYHYFKELNRQGRYHKVVELYENYTKRSQHNWDIDSEICQKIIQQYGYAQVQVGFNSPNKILYANQKKSGLMQLLRQGGNTFIVCVIGFTVFMAISRLFEFSVSELEDDSDVGNKDKKDQNDITKTVKKLFLALLGEDTEVTKESNLKKKGVDPTPPPKEPSLEPKQNSVAAVDDSKKAQQAKKNSGFISRIFDRSSDIQEEKNIPTRFTDVIGIDEFKEELTELVDYLKNPKKYQDAGAKLPKGILLVGPPGTGKTLLARALAGEAGCSFYYKSGSEFDEMFVGVGASRVRELFKKARQTAPSIIFIDEIDSVCGKRSALDQSHSRDTVNQILAEMDGFRERDNVIVIGATNFEQSIDSAIKRPGRFDKTINVPYPDIRGREQLFDYYLKKIQTDQSVKSKELAKQTSGFTGADIANMVNISILNALKHNRQVSNKLDFDFALDRISMGIGRKNMFVTDEDKLKTAYHEGGHTITALLTKESTPLHKVTILPRGSALGFTSFVPETDKLNLTKKGMIASIDVAMGGRVAEEIYYGNQEITTGCINDLQRATEMAYAYVRELGMDENLTLISQTNGIKTSNKYNYILDKEVQKILKESYERVKRLLKQNEQQLQNLAKELMEHETLDAQQVKDIVFNGRKIEKK
ncbi:hypothetical protein ABPG74_000014 [Tetrahymena malaccensis]